MFKTAAKSSTNVQDILGNSDIGKSESSFNLVTLWIVAAAIEAASGLNKDIMFWPKLERLRATIRWALGEVEGGAQAAQWVSDVQNLRSLAKKFEKVFQILEQPEDED